MPRLRRALRRARPAPRVVVLDLGELSHADVPGVQVIVDEANRARSENRRLIFLRAPLPIDVVFAAMGGFQGPDVIELASREPVAPGLLALPRKDQAA
ncbi:MAG TPA: STAS domain-containing protein [Solirubrobacteraceae bacterium]|nr:STAS domain-containing protein [Solirubrobacteraceae bacterium]